MSGLNKRTQSQAVQTSRSSFGKLMKSWRAHQGISQLGLANNAGVSARHLSFIETGRSQPSRELVVHLSEVLGVPHRQRNELLLAAGYAPIYEEHEIQSDHLRFHRHVVELILKGFEPYSAVAFDRRWDILLYNAGFQRTLDAIGLGAGDKVASNLLTLMFSKKGLRSHIKNWDEAGYQILQRLHRDAIEGTEAQRDALRSVLMSFDVPPSWKLLDVSRKPEAVLPIHLEINGVSLKFFTTITTLGAAQDITLQELQVEAFLPGDEKTEEILNSLVRGS